jgi:arylsulfatase
MLRLLVSGLGVSICTVASAQIAPMQSAPALGFPQPPRAPVGAPNILIIMTDDVGFGASSTFGGPIPTPVFDALARDGVRFNRFNTNAICSPTRAALLTGRNPHSVGYGAIAEVATASPGYNSEIPKTAATFGEILKENGYSTSWFGKNHNTPMWEVTPIGPYDRWPTGMGFERFYGFNGGKIDQWAPALIDNTTPVQPADGKPDYNLDKDLADKTIDWLRTQHYLFPDKPFVTYYAPASAHAPHYAPQEWIDRFHGKFDQGWDKVREQTLALQKRLGVVPGKTELTRRPGAIPAWSSLSPDQKRVSARLMEVYAANLSYSDDQIGRVVQYLKDSGRYDNTLIIYIQGDNGASAEGGLLGSTGRSSLNGASSELEPMLEVIDEIGSPATASNYPVGWAWAMNSPLQWTKAIGSHFGGIRNGMVVSWPAKVGPRRQAQDDFIVAMDVAPTLYDLIGITPPAAVNGVTQMPIEGRSFAKALLGQHIADDRTLYFEALGTRSLYRSGWMLSSTPQRLPWQGLAVAALPEDAGFELYHVANDFSQAHDLAARMPAKVAEMKAMFEVEATKHNVLPLDGRAMERAAVDNRPYAINRPSVTLYPSTTRYDHGAFPFLRGKSWTVRARVDLADANTSGMIVTDGGMLSGWGLFMKGGKPSFVFRTSPDARDVVRIDAPRPIDAGAHTIEIRFAASGRPGEWGVATMLIDGQPNGTTTLPRTVPLWQSSDGAAVGLDMATPIVPEYALPFTFGGKITDVVIEMPAG